MNASVVRDRRGNILIESIVAVSLILIGLLGVFGLITSSVRQNKDVSFRATGTYLAAEGIEVMKNIIDTDVVSTSSLWTDTVGGSGGYETYEVEYDSDNSDELGPVLLPEGQLSERPLLLDNDTGLYGYSELGNVTPSPFTRTVAVSSENPDELTVTSIVEWKERGEQKRVTLQTIFTDWRTDI